MVMAHSPEATARSWAVSLPWGLRAKFLTTPAAQASAAASPAASMIEPISDKL